MKKLYLILLSIALSSQVSLAQVCVTETGAGLKNGDTWANAYDKTQLQQAINKAESATIKQVWVAKGIYKPTESLSSTGKLTDGADVTDRDKAFILKAGVEIYGGFPDSGTPGIGDRDFVANETILSGDFLGNDISDPLDPDYAASKADNAYHVVASRNASLDAVLNGFTIQNGFANGTKIITEGGEEILQNTGGAIMLRGANTAMTFANLIIKDNESTAFSAGVQLRGSGANKQYHFNKVIFENNNGGGSGGALYIYFTSATTTVNITEPIVSF